MPVVDLTGIPTSYEAIDAGEYPAVFTKFQNALSKSSNQPKVTLTFTIKDPSSGYDGRQQWMDCSLQPQALQGIKRSMLALGADPDELEGAIDTDVVLSGLINTQCVIAISRNPYTNPSTGVTTDQNRIEKISPF